MSLPSNIGTLLNRGAQAFSHLRGCGAAHDGGDGLAASQENEGGHLLDGELLGQAPDLVDVDLAVVDAVVLGRELAEAGEQVEALAAPRGHEVCDEEGVLGGGDLQKAVELLGRGDGVHQARQRHPRGGSGVVRAGGRVRGVGGHGDRGARRVARGARVRARRGARGAGAGRGGGARRDGGGGREGGARRRHGGRSGVRGVGG